MHRLLSSCCSPVSGYFLAKWHPIIEDKSSDFSHGCSNFHPELANLCIFNIQMFDTKLEYWKLFDEFYIKTYDLSALYTTIQHAKLKLMLESIINNAFSSKMVCIS